MHYTDNPTVPRDSIVTMINLDMIGRGRATDLPGGGPGYVQAIGSRRLSSELGRIVDEVAGATTPRVQLDYQYDAPRHPQQFYCRSDHYMYARYGIPVAFFSTGGHPDYHQLTDEVQYIDFDKLALVTRFVYGIGERVASQPAPPVVDQPRPDPTEPCVQ
jgi:Zn-dependent M28 family amino/carboxypeptidase